MSPGHRNRQAVPSRVKEHSKVRPPLTFKPAESFARVPLLCHLVGLDLLEQLLGVLVCGEMFSDGLEPAIERPSKAVLQIPGMQTTSGVGLFELFECVEGYISSVGLRTRDFEAAKCRENELLDVRSTWVALQGPRRAKRLLDFPINFLRSTEAEELSTP